MEISFDSLDTPALTKAYLSEMLHEQLGLNKREAKDYIEAFFEVIAAQLVEGQDVKISGFGNFEIRSKAGRPGRNPRTGEPGSICLLIQMNQSKKPYTNWTWRQEHVTLGCCRFRRHRPKRITLPRTLQD